MLKRVFNYFPKNLNVRFFVSKSKKSHEEREKRELKKIEKFWENIDKEIEDKRSIEKEIEAKYKNQENLIGNTVHGSQLVDIYYVPLTKDDESLLDLFSTKAADDIRRGGRILLQKELEQYGKEHPGSGSSINFTPMTLNDIKEIKEKYYEIYSNNNLFEAAIQRGKPFIEALNKEKTRILLNHQKFISHMNYISNYSQIKNPPFNTKIKIDFQKFEDPHYVKLVLAKNKYDENELNNKLLDIYHRYYNTLVETFKEGKINMNDQTLSDKLSNNVEKNLIDRSKVFLNFLTLNNYTLNMTKDQSNTSTVTIFDKILVKGVHVDREKNFEADDYIYIDSNEGQGIRYYMNKFYAGYAARYGSEKEFLTSTKKFIESEAYGELSYNIKEANRKIILRISIFIKSNDTLNILKDGKETLDYEGYSGKHLAVFENELIPPHHSYFIEHSFDEWLGKHTLNHNNWKLVDIDNFMKGNTYFKDTQSFKEIKENSLDLQLFDFIEKEFPGVNFDNVQPTVEPKEVKQEKTEKGKKQQAQPKKKVNKEGREISLNYRVVKINTPQFEENEYTKIDKEDLPKINAAKFNYPKDRITIIQSFIESIDNSINNNVNYIKYSSIMIERILIDLPSFIARMLVKY
jgi:hypothetical protein